MQDKHKYEEKPVFVTKNRQDFISDGNYGEGHTENDAALADPSNIKVPDAQAGTADQALTDNLKPFSLTNAHENEGF